MHSAGTWATMVLRIILICNRNRQMYICICNGITEREIRGAASLGCTTIDDLSRELGVATCCGKCAPEAGNILRSCAGCPKNAAFGGGHD